MRILLFISLILFSLDAYSQKVVNARGEYVYHAPENITLEQARQTAIERARLDAIAKAFGTDVSQTNMITVNTTGESSETAFNSMGGTEVKGEWIADTKEPEVSIGYESGMLVVGAKVWGKIREKTKVDYELSVQILCNGRESEKFRNNDRLSVRFKSPVKGYLSIYLVDDNVRQAYCLLPYENEDGRARAIKNNETRMLLSTEDPVYPYREETILTTERTIEYDRLVFVFSRNQFAMPLTDMGDYLPELSTTDFERWLQKNRIKDTEMNVVEKVVEIRK
ncbi:MAG: DUF4384 domain-containing protein [Bacteroidales bacterium]|nr:DUF4384 domain-containing protein [Bacteroidales bacterium]